MLLNKNKIYQINSYTPEHLPWIRENSDRSYVVNKNLDDADYWMIQFSDPNSFVVYPIEILVPEDFLKRVKNRDAYLILDNAYEAFYAIVDSVYEHVVKKYDIPPEQIIISSGNYDLVTYVKDYAAKINQSELKVDYFNYWEWHTYSYYMNLRQKWIDTLAIKDYPKKFLFLNRRWRPHRTAMLALLFDQELASQGHISFKKADDNPDWHSAVMTAANYYRDTEIVEVLKRQSEPIKNSLPLDLDDLFLDPFNDRNMMFNTTMDTYYKDTYFSIVSETTSDRFGIGRFFTEKIFKPIALRHPFLICGTDKTLEALRQLGYKTFSGLIDESYDLEPVEAKRFQMVAAEARRLSNLQGAELEYFLTEAKKICWDNYVTFRNRTQYIWKMNY
jgi:hypothetical protein